MAATATADIPTTSDRRARAVYTRVEVLGLAFIASSPLVMIVAGLIAGLDLSDAGFLMVPIALGALGAGLVWRFGTWAKAVGMVLSLGAATMMFWVVFGLAYPSSFADFVPGILLPLGVLLTLGGGIAAIVRRKRMETEATAGERRIVAGAVGLVLVAAVVSGALHLLGTTTADAAGAAATSTMADFEFVPTSYEVASGDSILVHNADPFVHTFTVPELGIDETVLPGSKQLIEITGDTGTYTVYCEPHADMDEKDPAEAGMAATLTIQ